MKGVFALVSSLVVASVVGLTEIELLAASAVACTGGGVPTECKIFGKPVVATTPSTTYTQLGVAGAVVTGSPNTYSVTNFPCLTVQCVDASGSPLTTTVQGSCKYSYVSFGTPCPSGGYSNGHDCDDDANDFCDTKGLCVDVFFGPTKVCRAPELVYTIGSGITTANTPNGCDYPEVCTGVHGFCPADQFVEKDKACLGGSNGNRCDDDENDKCDGRGGCVDAYFPLNTICRASDGPCDKPELCEYKSGSTTATTCPATDSYYPAPTATAPGVLCRRPNLPCDSGSFCGGSSKECPEGNKKSSGTSCTLPTKPWYVSSTCINSGTCQEGKCKSSGSDFVATISNQGAPCTGAGNISPVSVCDAGFKCNSEGMCVSTARSTFPCVTPGSAKSMCSLSSLTPGLLTDTTPDSVCLPITAGTAIQFLDEDADAETESESDASPIVLAEDLVAVGASPASPVWLLGLVCAAAAAVAFVATKATAADTDESYMELATMH